MHKTQSRSLQPSSLIKNSKRPSKCRKQAKSPLSSKLSHRLTASFSTMTTSQQNNQLQYVQPTLSTSQASMLYQLPESQQFLTDISHGRFGSAEDAVNRMEGIFQSVPMPALHIEVLLRKSRVYQSTGRFQQQAVVLENMLTQLETNLPFKQNLNTTWEQAKSQQNVPFLGQLFEKEALDTFSISDSPTSSPPTTPSLNHKVNKNMHIHYQSSPIFTTYLPIISTLTLSYLHTHQFSKAKALLSKFHSQLPLATSSLPSIQIEALNEALVTLSSLQGLILQTELAETMYIDESKLKSTLLDMNSASSDQNLPPMDQNGTLDVPKIVKPKFVLKTTHVVQGTETITRSIDSTTNSLKTDSNTLNDVASIENEKSKEKNETNTPPLSPVTKHNYNANDSELESTEEILKRKGQCQTAQLEAQAQEDLQKSNKIDVNDQNENQSISKLNKHPLVSPGFQSLLTTCHEFSQKDISNDFDISALLSPELLVEIDSLPLSLSITTSTPRDLFIEAFKHFIHALSFVQLHTSPTSHLLPLQSTLIIDTFTHLTSLFHLILTVQQSLQHKNTTVQSYLAVLNLIQSSFLLQHIDGYQTLSNPKNIQVSLQLNTPYALSPFGPRLITKQLAIQSSNFTHLNTTLKHAEQLLSFADYNQLETYLITNSISDDNTILSPKPLQSHFFSHFDKTKGTALSPLLLAIGFDYLSLNPINTEGVARTAVNYLEKQQGIASRTFHHQQVLLDSYYSYAYILSNLSWNDKPRTGEAITTIFKGVDMVHHANQLQGSPAANDILNLSVYTPVTTERLPPVSLFPRTLTFDVTNKFTQINSRTHFKATKTPFNWDQVKSQSLDYNISFKPTQRGVEQWITERYSM